MSEAEGLWGPAQVAAFLGYAESTVARMVTTHPEKLPPRVQAVTRPRWVPEVCRAWAEAHSKPTEAAAPKRGGRPRKAVA